MKYIYTFLLLCLLTAQTSWANYAATSGLATVMNTPPQNDYQTLESDHFILHYSNNYLTEAQETLKWLEHAHTVLSPFVRHEPSRKVRVTIIDNSDFANGAATAIAHQGIVLYLTNSDPYTSIGDYEDWLKGLVLHEYTHYLTLDPTSGLFAFARYLFGDALLPNHGWPSWLAEGLAVYVETIFTRQGRGDGGYYANITNHAAYTGKLGTSFLPYNELTGPVPYFPFGDSAYMAGYQIVAELSKHNPNWLALVTDSGSARLPWFLNGTLENTHTNPSSPQTFQEAWTRSNNTYHQAASVTTQATQSFEQALTYHNNEGELAWGTTISPNKKYLAFTNRVATNVTKLLLKNLETQEVTTVDDLQPSYSIDFSNDSRKIFYSKLSYTNRFNSYFDIYSYDIISKTTQQLTFDMRAKDPAYCNNEVVYTVQTGRKSHLRAVNLTSLFTRTLYTAADFHHVATPTCHDGWVYFSEHNRSSDESIFRMRQTDGVAEKVFDGAKHGVRARFPRVKAEKILFTASNSMGARAAIYDQENKQLKLSPYFAGGIWSPQWTADESIAAISYVTSNGLRAATVKFDALFQETSQNTKLSGVAKAPQANTPPEAISNVEEKSYRFYRSLEPRIWSPLFTVQDTEWRGGAMIFGTDDINSIEYSTSAWYDSAALRNIDRVGATANLSFRLGSFDLALVGQHEIAAFATNNTGIIITNTDDEVKFVLSRVFPYIFSNIRWSTYAGTASTVTTTQNWTIRQPQRLELGMTLTFDGQLNFLKSITADRGYYVHTEGRGFSTSDEQAFKSWLHYTQHIPLFFDNTRLRIKTLAGYADPKGAMPLSYFAIGGLGNESELDPSLRGYPRIYKITDRALMNYVDLTLPVAQVFSSLTGHFPLFFKNIGFSLFHDAGFMRNDEQSRYQYASSMGASLTLNTLFFYMAPIRFKFDVAKGNHSGGEYTYYLSIGL